MISLFYNEVAKWNALRRERVHEVQLCTELLAEECEEANDAYCMLEDCIAEGSAGNSAIYAHEAHLVKELFDVMFVASGILWRMGFSPAQVDKLVAACVVSQHTRSEQPVPVGAKGSKGAGFIPAETQLFNIIQQIREAS